MRWWDVDDIEDAGTRECCAEKTVVSKQTLHLYAKSGYKVVRKVVQWFAGDLSAGLVLIQISSYIAIAITCSSSRASGYKTVG